MKGNKAVVGVFSYVDDIVKATRKAKENNLECSVYSPVPVHDIEEVALPGKSFVRMFTLTGSILGLIGGFSLAILCSMDWPLRVSAKDIVSIPGFVVIGYECTILLGAIATLLGVLTLCRIPDIFRKTGYDQRFTRDKFGLVVECNSDQLDGVMRMLNEAGAEEVEEKDAL